MQHTHCRLRTWMMNLFARALDGDRITSVARKTFFFKYNFEHRNYWKHIYYRKHNKRSDVSKNIYTCTLKNNLFQTVWPADKSWIFFNYTRNLMNFLNGIIRLELLIIIFNGIKMRTWNWSANFSLNIFILARLRNKVSQLIYPG